MGSARSSAFSTGSSGSPLRADGAPTAGERRSTALGAAWVAALALGVEPPLTEPAWDEALALASRERLLPLAWTRGARTVRERATATESGAWRLRAIGEIAATERRVAQAVAVVRLLRGAGLEPVMLRGAGLGALVHGSASMRPSGDVDLLVSAGAWHDVDSVLRGDGWRREYGEPPAETAYRRGSGASAEVLEIHCALDDSPLMRHLRLPAPDWETVQVGGCAVRAHAGALLPSYLAVHAAKRVLPPLLWFVDLHVLWARLGEEGRAAAREAATRHRMARYLDWGLARADAVWRAANGEVDAMTLLGFGAERRTDGHNALRMASLAATPVDALRVAARWALPPDERTMSRRTMSRLLGRATKPLDGVVRKTAERPRAPSHALRLDRPLHELVPDVLHDAGALWIRATGDSMRPSIPAGTLVRLVQPHGALEPGMVVLARMPFGGAVLHRVVEERDGLVRLRGDNTVADDPPVTRASVVAIADLRDDGNGARPISRRPAGRLAKALRSTARTVRRGVHAMIARTS